VLRSQTSIELKSIAAVLREQRLAVPQHQRCFEWTVDEVQELLEDLDGAFGQGEEYFLGTIVVISGDGGGVPSVLDGQQRLATVAVLLAGIADQLTGHGDPERGKAVRDQYLMPYDIESGQRHPQLRLNGTDEPYFSSLLGETVTAPTRGAPDSHVRLFQARERVGEWLRKHPGCLADPVQWLARFSMHLTQSANVILVKVPDDANAFLIFETLNDRGLDLSIADLLKNYLLGRAAEDLAVVLSHWTNAMASLSSYGGENAFTTFLRHLWSSKYSVVREKDLYRDIKARIVSTPHVVTFADELSQNSFLYSAILAPEQHEFWGAGSKETPERVGTLHLLGLEQYRPMLLAAMAHLPMPEVEALVTMLINWNVRLLVVGGLGGGVMERHYSQLGRDIRGGQLKSAAEIMDRAREFVPNDREFQDAFALARVSKVTLARYYLRSLEDASSPERAAELVPTTTLTLEHVLPDRPLGNWPQFSDEDAAAFRNRIGNLVLLAEKMNSKLRSAPFTEKRPVYAASNLLLTRQVADFEDWTRAAIDARQGNLAELAVRVWPVA
jgi:hypothetical protein